MKITFLGTSSGKTSLKRYHSSILFSLEKYNLLIDAGDGISRTLINNRINFNSINGILFTHLHPDHFSGLPSLIVQMKMMNRNKPLEIFIHKSLVEVVEYFIIHSYLLPEKMGFEINYKGFNDDERFNITEKFLFIAKKNSHLHNLEKYQNKYSSLSLYCASFLFESDSKKIIYTSDIGAEEDLLLFSEIVPDLFISEVTHISPLILLEKIKSIKPDMTYLTHYADEDIPALSEIMANLPNALKEKVILAVDNISFDF
ncbi:MAG: MBL fold metallo-hydrolase [Ignavibacteriaceae bacterium]|nr:MBL fold metallo-hydrolase [Ignavibacteriaceae bacterium]